MESDRERVRRFIEAFEDTYKRKPRVEDAEGDFMRKVAQDMHMSVGGARYYLRGCGVRTERRKLTNSAQ